MGDDPGFAAWERQIEEKRDKDRDSKKARKEKGDENVDWKERPPYALEDPDNKRDPLYTGHCHCEKIKFEVFDVPKDAHFCHCHTCQKIHGSPVHWSAIIAKEDVHFIHGAEGLSFYRTSDKKTVHELPCKLSCSHCHSPIADEGRKMLLLYPSLLNLDSPEQREPWTPRRHSFYSHRALDVHDGQEKYAEMQYDSELMDETSDKVGVIGKNSRVDRDPNEEDSKERSDNPGKGQNGSSKKRKKN